MLQIQPLKPVWKQTCILYLLKKPGRFHEPDCLLLAESHLLDLLGSRRRRSSTSSGRRAGLLLKDLPELQALISSYETLAMTMKLSKETYQLLRAFVHQGRDMSGEHESRGLGSRHCGPR